MVFIMILLLMFSPSISAYNETTEAFLSDFQVVFNEEIKQSISNPIIVDNYSYLPVRDISNLFGCIVEWDAEKGQIHIDMPRAEYEAYTPYEDNGLYGYKNEDGEIIIEPMYVYAEEFDDGLAIVQFQDLNYGFINMNGICIYQSNHMPCSHFNDGLALVCDYDIPESAPQDKKVIISGLDPKYYFIDKAGNHISERYSSAEPFSEGLAVVQIEGEVISYPGSPKRLYSYISKNGKLATDLKFDEAVGFENGYAKVVLNGQPGRIDKEFHFTSAE